MKAAHQLSWAERVSVVAMVSVIGTSCTMRPWPRMSATTSTNTTASNHDFIEVILSFCTKVSIVALVAKPEIDVSQQTRKISNISNETVCCNCWQFKVERSTVTWNQRLSVSYYLEYESTTVLATTITDFGTIIMILTFHINSYQLQHFTMNTHACHGVKLIQIYKTSKWYR